METRWSQAAESFWPSLCLYVLVFENGMLVLVHNVLLNMRPKERSFNREKGSKGEIPEWLHSTCEGGRRSECLTHEEELRKEKSEEMHSIQSVLGPLTEGQEGWRGWI